GNAAGGEGRNGAVGEGQPGLGLVGETADADDAFSGDGRERRASEREDEIDVVDHQVQHDVDIGRASAPWRTAQGSDAAGGDEARAELLDRGREALDVADL